MHSRASILCGTRGAATGYTSPAPRILAASGRLPWSPSRGSWGTPHHRIRRGTSCSVRGSKPSSRADQGIRPSKSTRRSIFTHVCACECSTTRRTTPRLFGDTSWPTMQSTISGRGSRSGPRKTARCIGLNCPSTISRMSRLRG